MKPDRSKPRRYLLLAYSPLPAPAARPGLLLAAVLLLAGCARQSASPAVQPGRPPAEANRRRAEQIADAAAAELDHPPDNLRRAFRREVVALLTGPGERRREAAEQLGYLRRPAAVGPLSLAARDDDPAVRAEAITALGRISGGDARPALLGGLADSAAGVRAAACRAVARRGRTDRGLADALQTRLADADPDVRAEAALALVAAGDASAADALARAAADPSPKVAAAAVAALGQLAGQAALDGLLAASEHPSAKVRYVAVGAMGALGDRRATPALIRRIGDSHPTVRLATVTALGELGDPRAAEALRAARAIDQPGLQAAIDRALAAIEAAR